MKREKLHKNAEAKSRRLIEKGLGEQAGKSDLLNLFFQTPWDG